MNASGPDAAARRGGRRGLKGAGLALLLAALALGLWFGLDAPLGGAIFQLHPPFLNTLQAGVQRRLSPELWNSVMLPVLEAPVWLLPFLLSALLLLLGYGLRRRG